jgi:hypothetical protein
VRIVGSLMALLVLAGGVSSACAPKRTPAPAPVPEIDRPGEPRRPLIFLHGFIGSKLRDPRTGKVAWGTMANVLMGGDSDDLALSLDPPGPAAGNGAPDVPGEALRPFAIYDSLWGRDFYRVFLRSLRADGGYQIGDPDNPRPGDNAFVFLYDWRRDNVDSARRLGEAIDRLRAARGRPGERYDIVAHSQGGLIARYYIKYGARDVLPDGPPFHPGMEGARHINKVLLVGTPNRGCLESLRVLHVGLRKVFRPMRPAVVFTMPSLYQMLPPPGSAVFADPEGNTLALDLYDAATWVSQGWSVFAPTSGRSPRPDDRHVRFLEGALKRAALFHQALEAPEPEEEPVEYHVLGGDCTATLRRAVVTRKQGRPELLFAEESSRRGRRAGTPDEPLYGPGDGTVLAQSLLAGHLRFSSALFVCGSHGVLPNNPDIGSRLLHLLQFWRKDPAASVPGGGPSLPGSAGTRNPHGEPIPLL